MKNTRLTSESIVLLSDAIHPAQFNAKFLSDAGFLHDRNETEAIRVGPITQVSYEDGYLFEALGDRIRIERVYGSGDGKEELEADPELTSAITNFAKATTFLPITAVGVNFRLLHTSSRIDTPAQMGSWQFGSLTVMKQAGESWLTAVVSQVQNSKTGANGVQFDLNFHTAAHGKEVGPDLLPIISGRQGYLETAKEAVNELASEYVTHE